MAITRITDATANNNKTTILYTNEFNLLNIPTEPSELPISPRVGDIVIENFSNQLTTNPRITIYWVYNGTSWVQDGEIIYHQLHFTDEVAGRLIADEFPTSPVNYAGNEELNYVFGDTLHEEYDNGYVEWFFDNSVAWFVKYQRIYNDDIFYKPEDYGPIGAGTSAVQEAINAAFNAGGGTVLLSRNQTYGPINTPLEMKRNVKILGQSYSSSVLKFGPGISGIVIDTTEIYCELDNFSIRGTWDTSGVNGPAIHFVANEPREIRIGRIQIVWWGGVGVQNEFGCNPFELEIGHLWYLFGNPQGSPIFNWLGGGSYIRIGSIFFQPDYNSSCTGVYLYNGDFVIDKLNIGGGVVRGLQSEYVNLILNQVNWEPHGNVAQSEYVIRFGVGLNRGSFFVGCVYIAQVLSSLERPNYVYYIGHETPFGILGPVYLGSDVNNSVVFCPNDKTQGQTQLYIGPAAHVNNNGQGKVVALGSLGAELRVGTSPGGTTYSELAEIYGNLALISNNPVLLRTWAYSFTIQPTAYNPFELEVSGNSSTGVRRKFGRLIVRATDPTNTSEDSEISFYVLGAGVEKKILSMTSAAVTIDGNLVVTGSGGGGGSGITTSLSNVASFDTSAIPSAPVSAPGSPATGDIHIETFDNTTGNSRVVQRWTYNGSAWVLTTDTEYNIRNFSVSVGSNLNPSSLPTTPNAPGASTDYIPGDTLHEEYNNGYMKWVYTLSGWSVSLGRVYTTNNLVTLGTVSSFNMNSVPTAPSSPPSSAKSGDVYIETYNNTNQNQKVIIRWTYNGSAWVMNGTPEYNLKRYFATIASNLTAGALPSTPVTPGSSTGYVTGDTLIETYNNGHLEWVFGTTTWTLSGSRVHTNNTYVVKSAVNWDETGTAPTTPNSPPSSPLINDILIQSYDNGTRNNAVTRYWSYNGSTWVELTNGIHRFNMVFTNVPGTALTYGVDPTAALAATTTSYVNGDILWEKYTNGYGLYKFNNGSWALQTHGLEAGRIQDAADFQATLGPGVDGYYVIYDHDILKFTLSAT